MRKKFLCFVCVALLGGIVCPLASAAVLDWNAASAETNDWSTATNWEDEGTALPPATPPNFSDRVEISAVGALSPVIDTEAAEADQVRIGRGDGAGELTIAGGSLTTDATGVAFRVGNGAAGTLNISGGALTVGGGTMTTGDGGNWKGQITMTGGSIDITGVDRDLNMDEFAGSTAASNLTMSAGTITIADILLVDNFASIDLSGGSITSAATQAGGLRVRRDAVVNVTGGLLETKDDLQLGDAGIPGGTINIDGGIVRAFRWAGPPGATGVININDTGLLQFLNSEETVAEVQSYITSGYFATSGSALGVSIVNVDGLDYTQVNVIPEPASLLLAGLGGLGLLAACRRKRR